MTTRYSRPLRSGNAAFSRAWFALPALLLALALGLTVLLGNGPGAPTPRPEAAAELPSLPTAA